jgi:DNA-binding NarL/FixJ family response regulator
LSVAIFSCGGDGGRVAAILDADDSVKAGQVESLEQFDAAPDALVVVFDRLGREEVTILQRARSALPTSSLVVVAATIERRALRRTLAQGVDGVVHERNAGACLGAVVRAVCSGQMTLPREFREAVATPVLSSREKQILGMVVMGFSNADIAAKLYLAESTVKSHLSSAFEKLGVRSRNEAAALILDAEHGLGTGILRISSGDEGPVGTAAGI